MLSIEMSLSCSYIEGWLLLIVLVLSVDWECSFVTWIFISLPPEKDRICNNTEELEINMNISDAGCFFFFVLPVVYWLWYLYSFTKTGDGTTKKSRNDMVTEWATTGKRSHRRPKP